MNIWCKSVCGVLMVSPLVAVHAQDRVDGEIVSAGVLVKTFSIEPGQSLNARSDVIRQV